MHVYTNVHPLTRRACLHKCAYAHVYIQRSRHMHPHTQPCALYKKGAVTCATAFFNLFVCVCVCVCVRVCVSVGVCARARVCVCLSVFLLVYLSICLSVILSVCLSFFLSVYHVSVCVRVYECIGVCIHECVPAFIPPRIHTRTRMCQLAAREGRLAVSGCAEPDIFGFGKVRSSLPNSGVPTFGVSLGLEFLG